MLMYDIISKKRDGYELSAAEIDFWISGYTPVSYTHLDVYKRQRQRLQWL